MRERERERKRKRERERERVSERVREREREGTSKCDLRSCDNSSLCTRSCSVATDTSQITRFLISGW